MDLGLHGKRAVQLRYLQTMREVTSERNTTTFSRCTFACSPAAPGPRRHASTRELIMAAFACLCAALAYDTGLTSVIALSMHQPNQRVTVDLSTLTIQGVSFSQNVQKALGSVVRQVSAEPPVYLVELLFSF
jgi:hypothetical protein